MTPHAREAGAACVGLDWADATHEGCFQAAGTTPRAFLVRAHRPEAIEAWVQTRGTRCNGPPVAVGLERPKGPIVSALRPEDVLVRFPVTPFTLATDRDALTPSRAHDDPTAAALQVAWLLPPRDTRTPRSPHSPTRRAGAQRVADRRRLVGATVRRTHRVTSALTNVFPHVLQWFQEQETGIVCDVLSRWPTLTAGQRARRTTLERGCRAHHGRAADVITTRIAAITSAGALTTEAGVITPNALLVQALVAQLRVTGQAIADGDNVLAPRAQDHPDCPVCDAFPGAGAVCAPRLLVAWGAHRARDAAAAARQT